MYIAEFQGPSAKPNRQIFSDSYQLSSGGANDVWGGPGYETCAKQMDASFANVFYKANVGFGATMMSFYMTYGGTNWG